MGTSHNPRSTHEYKGLPPGPTIVQPPSCVKHLSSIGLSSFQCFICILRMFCNRNVANSNGRNPHPLKNGKLSNLLPIISFVFGFNSNTFGHRPAICPCFNDSSIQYRFLLGLPKYPLSTAGKVPCLMCDGI